MGGACSTDGGDEKYIQDSSRTPEGYLLNICFETCHSSVMWTYEIHWNNSEFGPVDGP
jgi:hypothetical protein